MRHFILLPVCLLLVSSVALGDDVTMKNGKVYKDLTLVKETKSAYIYLTHEGRKMTLGKKSVEKVVKKPTLRGELLDKIEAVGKKKDPDALTDIGLWAKSKGMEKDAKDLFKKALRFDRNHVKAHEALGDRMMNGKWVKEAVWKKAMAKELAKQYEAWGWKEVKGEWMPRSLASRIERKLVEVQGQWVDTKLAKRIEKKNLTWAEGLWLTPEEKADFDSGLRKSGKRWLPIDELNDVHSDFQDPWVIQGHHVEIRANCKYKDAKFVLRMAEDFYKGMEELFGEKHPDIYEDGKGRLVFNVGRGVNSYRFLGGTFANGDRVSYKSSGYGCFYSVTYEEGRGAACSYIEGRQTWTEQWAANGVVHAFIGRMGNYLETDEKAIEALAGYIAGFGKEGKYDPPQWFFNWAINNPQNPFGTASTLADRIGYRTAHTLLQAGFFLHFLRTKNDKAFRDFYRGQVSGNAKTLGDLTKACLGDNVDSDTINSEFNAFLEAYKKSYKAGPNRT